MAIRIQADCVVSMVYRMTDTEGHVLDESTPGSPYWYIQGRGQILPALEKLLEGKTPGFAGELQLSPRDAYGDYKPTLVAEIPRGQFPANAMLSAGMKFNTTGPSGEPMVVRVIEVDEKAVTVDGNHPLAGMDLIFEIRVLDVREATDEEKESGRVSGESTVQPEVGDAAGGTTAGPGRGSGTLH